MPETLEFITQRVNSGVYCFAYIQNFSMLFETEEQQQVPTPFTPHLAFQSPSPTANRI